MASNSTDNPLVSVVVPNYNYARFLPQRLTNILNQTYSNIEVILLDDCSTDNSVAVIEQFLARDGRITRFVQNAENTGSPFRQWAKGIEFAQGELIWIAESDDDAESTFLSECVGLLAKYSQANICYTGSYGIDENNNLLPDDFDNWTDAHMRHPYAVYNGIDFATHNMYYYNYIYNASGVVFRKSAYDQLADASWQSMRTCGDWYFWTKMCVTGDVISIHQKLNKFRRHTRSVTARANDTDEKYLREMNECMELTFYVENSFRISALRRAVTHGHYLLLFKRKHLAPENLKSIVENLRQRAPHLTFEYIIYRIFRFLAKRFKSLDYMRRDRLKPE